MKPENLIKIALFLLAFFAINACREKRSVSLPEISALKAGSTVLLFDEGWRFYRGDTSNAGNPSFDDSGWRLVDLPHDWSIEDIPGTDSPLDSTVSGGIDAGYFAGGTGWYRKTFFVPASLKNKRFTIRFDGVYMNSDVWINGKHAGNHPYGYTSFMYDITSEIQPGDNNIIAVKVRNEGRNSRWYSGSGIYRHVWLTVAEPISIKEWSLSVSSNVESSGVAKINISSVIINCSDYNGNISVKFRIIDPEGKEAEETVSEHLLHSSSEEDVNSVIALTTSELWSPETPNLYKAVCELYAKSQDGSYALKDTKETKFGIRTAAISAEKGFLLNGKPLKLKGGCVHHDNGPLGAAAFDRAEERRVELLKASGFNAIRCAHNPPSPAFLDACDRLGMLVIDEAFDMWREAKNPDDYHLWFDEWWKNDIESMVLRDRNHPSVIMWSIGNEIPERGKPEGAALAKEMADYVRALDPTRPVTSAVNSVTPDKDAFFATLDVCGYNYEVDKYISDHKRFPKRIIMGTESFPLEAFDYWMASVDNPWVIGDFVWTSFDYLGEASIGWLGYPHKGSFYPWHQAFCGDIDICGFKRPQSFYRDALWEERPNVSIFVKPPEPSFPLNPEKAEWSKWEWHDVVASWNWEGYEGKPLTIEVYSNCDEVELLLNGKSSDKQRISLGNRFIARWEVIYEPGTLLSRGYKAGKMVETSELKTSGKPARIMLTADRDEIKTGGQDISYITVEILDDQGIRHPKANNLINFKLEGPGEILSVGSSNPASRESYKRPVRKAYQGRCVVIVKSGKEPGVIKLKAESTGLEDGEITVNSIINRASF